MSVFFHCEEISFTLKNKTLFKKWIGSVSLKEKKKIDLVNYIFCSDHHLHQINQQYLQHDTYTDIITFDYATEKITGDVFISIDRVKENAELFKVSFDKELSRVIVHGALHLMGYKDKSKAHKAQMTLKEDFYLSLLEQMKK